MGAEEGVGAVLGGEVARDEDGSVVCGVAEDGGDVNEGAVAEESGWLRSYERAIDGWAVKIERRLGAVAVGVGRLDVVDLQRGGG